MPPAKRRSKQATTAPTPVESTRHVDTRVNIPTDELRDLVAEDELAPGSVGYERYVSGRDPSLDPQLVWKGKDQQDAAGFEVPAVPVYIQEKIDPRAIVENLRDTARAGEPEPELSLFDTFDGLTGYDLVEFYEHEANWANRLILGDSLLVMNSLAEKERMRGKVQMIYVDPPYGIKFGSNWQVSTRKRDVKDGKVEDVTRQPEQIKAFRDTWELGIHSYLSYLRDRFVVARDLLTETGSIFVQIGDENVHMVRNVLDEVFGSENFVSLITFKKTAGATASLLSGVSDYLLWFARDARCVKYRQVNLDKEAGGVAARQYTWVELADGTRRTLSNDEVVPPESRTFAHDNMTSQRPPGDFPVAFSGRALTPRSGYWKTNADGMQRLRQANRLMLLGDTLRYVRYIDDYPLFPLSNLWDDTVTSGFADPKVYVVQTNTKVIQRCMLMTTDPGDLVLDPTCGAGTTAYVAEQWGRRWITVDTSRVALALARTRLMSAKYPYYVLADSPEGAAKEAELTGVVPTAVDHGHDVRKGFVVKRVPHVTLKSIAQNPEIRDGMSREQIDAAIARHADTELLVDQPYEDRKKVRVTGRFTVESLSPHRTLEEPGDRAELTGTPEPEAVQFETMILDNLRKAGVQNTFKDERLVFDRLEPYAGVWLQGEGELTDAEGASRRVAVCIGPEHGTVSPDQVKEAAREALKGQGFDLLVVCGFAFDASAGERAKEFAPASDGFAEAAEERKLGRLRVLLARVNPDLAMGDELLKKTGAGNLFMVFGEPDVEIRRVAAEGNEGADGVVVEIHGVDVYDPTTGVVRSSSTEDIACWLVDTSYNGESFFVRHAYFTGGQQPYDSLAKTLRADIDEATWATLYSTVSRPFPPPATGKIAVKVINHYGDEVMQVYDV